MRQKYAISENSKQSFLKLQESGKISVYQRRIIQSLSVEPKTRAELVRICKAKYPSNLTFPLRELENQGLIYRAGKKFDQRTNREVTVYALAADTNPLYINRNLSTCSLHETGLDHSKKSTL